MISVFLCFVVILILVGETAKTTDAWFKQFIVTSVKWIINRLNEISYDYRTVASQIDQEQKDEKTKERVCFDVII